jgi:hybrid cluster-associated redox disulfide protein
MSTKITRDTMISDILEFAPETAPLFREIGMHCLGCAMSSDETVAEACMVHGVDPDAFVKKANELIDDFAS